MWGKKRFEGLPDKYLMLQKIAQRLRKLTVKTKMEMVMVMVIVKNVKRSSRDKIRKITKNKKKRKRNLSMPKNIMTEIYLQKPSSLDENHILQFQRLRSEIQ